MNAWSIIFFLKYYINEFKNSGMEFGKKQSSQLKKNYKV